MQGNDTMDQLTFNDLPTAMSRVLDKVENMERTLIKMRNDIQGAKVGNAKPEHTPLTIDEACDFLKIKKSNMYYHLRKKDIPAIKNGKNYIFFKDELLVWLESRRKVDIPMTIDEINDSLKKRCGKKTPPGLH